MNEKERARNIVDFYKSKTVVLTLKNGQLLPVGIHDTDNDNAICIPKEILQEIVDNKRTKEQVFADKKSYVYIPLLDIVSITG